LIIIPELETVVILTPRTGTRSLKNQLMANYPNAFMLYRHMEADGVPHGYDRWPKVGVVRDPTDRLWSLYNYLQRFGLDWCTEHDETYTAQMRASVAVPFEQWILDNNLPFTQPYDSAGLGRFYPAYACRHPLPENRKSQFMYLRPDLGTEVYRYRDQLGALFARLGVAPSRSNEGGGGHVPCLTEQTWDYVERWFKWDLENA